MLMVRVLFVTATVSAEGVFSSLEEMVTQKAIRLSELPLSIKIQAVYQTIGQMTCVYLQMEVQIREMPL